jgi:hypothetical protein
MMQILTGSGLPQQTPNPAPQPTLVVGPAQPTAPIEPSRRVTGNRNSGRGDLQPHQQRRSAKATPGRGRLIDLFA